MALNMENYSLRKICKANGVDEKLLDKFREQLEEWLSTQAHLPKDMPKTRMEHLIISSKFDLEISKRKLDMYYTIRKPVPEVFHDRDPCGSTVTRILNFCAIVSLPKLTPEGYTVTIFKLHKYEPSDYDHLGLFKIASMFFDVRLRDHPFTMGNIFIIDLENYLADSLKKLTPATVRKSELSIIHGVDARIQGIYILNAPKVVDRILAITKPVLEPETYSAIQIFQSNELESVFRKVPRSIMPSDYGGYERSLNELQALWIQKLVESRDWFIEQEKVVVNEALRPGGPVNVDDIFGFLNSFQKLDVE